MEQQKINVLFVCTHNVSLSLMAEAITNTIGGADVQAFSAGITPHPHAHPLALSLLEQHAVSIDGLWGKPWQAFTLEGAPQIDVVVTLTEKAHVALQHSGFLQNRRCFYWPMVEPQLVKGSAALQNMAFTQAFAEIFASIDGLDSQAVRPCVQTVQSLSNVSEALVQAVAGLYAPLAQDKLSLLAKNN